MVTLLRPHEGIKCPNLPQEFIDKGFLLNINECKGCEYMKEIQQPWHGYAVRCELEGESDNRTIEYG